MPRLPLRVKIPRNTGELLSLANLIFKKHTALGADSPLKNMADYNWADTAPKLVKAIKMQFDVDALRKQAEDMQKEIALMATDIRGSVTGTRDVLLGINKKNPKKLGDYGFVVDDSPKAKKGDTANG